MNAELVSEDGAAFSGEEVLPDELVADGDPVSRSWMSHEFTSGPVVRTGIWEGEKGAIVVSGYPADEVFTVLEGRIELTNEDGSIISAGPGQSVLMPRGWSGIFRMVERSRKCFVMTGPE